MELQEYRQPMLTIEKALELTDKDQINYQIELRKDLLNQMVGGLYPQIVLEELRKLREKL